MLGDLSGETEYEVEARTVLVNDKIKSKQSAPFFFTTNSLSTPAATGKGYIVVEWILHRIIFI